MPDSDHFYPLLSFHWQGDKMLCYSCGAEVWTGEEGYYCTRCDRVCDENCKPIKKTAED